MKNRLRDRDVKIGDPVNFHEAGIDLHFQVASVTPEGRFRVDLGDGIAMPLPSRVLETSRAFATI